MKGDLELSRLKVKERGLICGDDYIKGNRIVGSQYGVIEAVDEFCKTWDWCMICTADHFWERDNYLSYVLAEKKYAKYLESSMNRRYLLKQLTRLWNR